MSKLQIAVIAVPIVAVVGCVVAFYGSEGALIERFPDIEPKLVKKVHREMFLEALRGKYNNITLDGQLDEDAMYDRIFLSKIDRLTKK